MKKNILVSGASFAGISTAYWMNRLGYNVTIIEIAEGLKKGGTPVNIRENTVDIVKRMGLLDQIRSNKLNMEAMEFRNAEDVTERMVIREQIIDDEYEIERDVLLNIMFEAIKDDVAFIFGDSITSLKEEANGVEVAFKRGEKRTYDLVFDCDGIHSAVRKYSFGEETDFSHFLETYFSITIVDKLLIRENTTQVYNEPGRAGMGWRMPELLEEVKNSTTFYFDKLCQMKMLSWIKGRVALVGDAGYCASPAAGMGGSLAIDGAAALADAFQNCQGDYELAFQEYDKSFRPFIEEVQANAAMFVDFLVPRTEKAIRERNSQTGNDL
ncbi:2-polyprenyl-6-methoxyphenol hydroxylase [Paenibacillus sp. CF384]|nr:2-polyprenyl-6-methoxyphenol hydroxylase [Paenibacillus sp. CF384]